MNKTSTLIAAIAILMATPTEAKDTWNLYYENGKFCCSFATEQLGWKKLEELYKKERCLCETCPLIKEANPRKSTNQKYKCN